MLKLKTLLSVLLLALCSGAYAQTPRTITGKVTGAGDLPVSAATVTEKGTQNSKITDETGTFSIVVTGASPVLVISSVGYGTKEVAVPAGSDVVNASLENAKGELNEVVVTALGISRQSKSLVYAAQTVKPAELTGVRDANNVVGSLQGKVANALIVQGSGGPGSGARIVLRGNRSIQGSNNALIVVDGVPINNNTNSAAGSDFGSIQSSDGASNINPDDIESMTVLKGASAAALYGSQAGNGVIVITTKKGRKGATTVGLNSGIGLESPFALPHFQNEYGQGNGGTINTGQGQSWGAKLNGQADTTAMGQPSTYSAHKNNVKDFFATGLSLNNSVNVTGGGENMQTYLSYTNNNISGIIPRNNMERHTVTLRVSNQFGKRFSTDAKVTYISQDIRNRPRTGEENAPVIDIYEMPRNYSLSDVKKYETFDVLGLPTPTKWPSTNGPIYQNPYWILNRTAINEARDRVIGFLSAKFQITPWLDIKGTANLDRYFDKGEEIYYQNTLLWGQPGGNYIRTDYTNSQKWFDASLNGNNSFGSDIKLSYHLGTIFQDIQFDQNQVNANGLNVPNHFSLLYASAPNPNPVFTETQTQSVFGQFTFAWKDAIFVDGSIRNDWDSRLPKPYTYNYPSIGVAAILSQLVRLPTAVSFLKASFNYAQVGNGGQAQLTKNLSTYAQGAGNGFIAQSSTFAIANLKPELVSSYEASIEARFMDDRLGFVVTAYKSSSKNQLLSLGTAPASGYSTRYINAGQIDNKGLEVVLNATPVRGRAFNWDMSLNFAMNRNKIVDLSPDLKRVPLGGGYGRSATPQAEVGGAYGDLVSAQKWSTNANGDFLVSAAGLPLLRSPDPDTAKFLGNFNPRATMGWTNNFTIGKFAIRLLVDGRIGGKIVSGTEMNLAFSGITKNTIGFREGGWVLPGVGPDGKPNTAAITSQQFWQTASGQRYGDAEFFTYDASSFRMREVSIGYNFTVPSTSFIKSIRFSAVARNLFWIYRGSSTFTMPGLEKRKMWFDPDMSLGNGNFQGVEYGTLPSTRTLGFNLQLGF